MAYKLNAITGLLDLTGSSGSGTTTIPEYTTDPVAPSFQDAWVLRSGGGGVGGGVYKATLGLGFPYLSVGVGGGAYTYQFSYYTNEGTIKRVTIS